jgi:hypothetical protein
MASGGDWLSPQVMGRLFFQKPPMLIWLAAASIRAFGLCLLTVRLPALLLGAAGIAAVFVWCAAGRSIAAGICAAGLLLMSPFWQTLSRLCYTDVLAGSFVALALTAVALDPQAGRRSSRVIFGLCAAAAVLSKSVAGVLPLLILFAYVLLLLAKQKPSFSSMLEMVLIFLAAAAPWHIYQLVVHPKWFFADYVQLELLGIGLHPEKTIFHRSSFFYVQRLVEMDPLLTLFAVVGIVGVLSARAWRGDPPKLLAMSWLVVGSLALLAFQSKNLPYLVFVLPPLAILGGLGAPRSLDRRPLVSVCLIIVLFAAKSLIAGEPWGLRSSAPPLASAGAMRAYYNLHRDSELIAVDPDDEFYSAALPLPRVRYCFLDPSGAIGRAVPYYAPLGITVSDTQFIGLPGWLPRFRSKLRAWGMDTVEPVASVILLSDPSQLAAVVASRPGSDFYIPAAWGVAFPEIGPAHQSFQYSGDRLFLLSKNARISRTVVPLPSRW